MARKKKDNLINDEDVAEAMRGRNDLEPKYFEALKGLHEQRQAINASLGKARKEAKDAGLNTRVMEAAVKRAMESDIDRDNREAFQAELAQLLDRLGDFVHTPLGEAALRDVA